MTPFDMLRAGPGDTLRAAPLREAFVLPGLFLTVALLGGLRITVVGSHVALVPPPLTALVLAFVLMSTIVRGRVLAPTALMQASRTPMENLSGLVVLLALFAASAQVLHLVTPERGLLHAIFAVFLFVQLLTSAAAAPTRTGLLRTVLVTLGSAFILRFIVLENLYSTDAGVVKRVLTALMAGVSLGGIEYTPHATATGYVAFLTIALYMIGLALLPAESERALVRSIDAHPAPGTSIESIGAVLVLVAGVMASACAGDRAGTPVNQRAASLREDALRAARVWQPPPVPPGQADFAANPSHPAGFGLTDVVDCRFSTQPVGGTTEKFNCEIAPGDVVKVKYGSANPELHAEVAATRLLRALGFGADGMFVVAKVRCAGCPRFPFQSLRCMARIGIESLCYPGGIDFSSVVEFDPAVIERRIPGRKIETFSDQGWSWYELDKIDPAYGGSARAEVDALRLIAVFLAHWDNKGANQRLMCPPGATLPDGACGQPLAIMQDVGATFGPTKLDLSNWRATPVWAHAAECRISMKSLPFNGATFSDRQISEDGRQFLLQLIEQLSRVQIENLFAGSRVTSLEALVASNRDASAWADAFQDKVQAIREAGPCPAEPVGKDEPVKKSDG
jgi:hypothetical protein